MGLPTYCSSVVAGDPYRAPIRTDLLLPFPRRRRQRHKRRDPLVKRIALVKRDAFLERDAFPETANIAGGRVNNEMTLLALVPLTMRRAARGSIKANNADVLVVVE